MRTSRLMLPKLLQENRIPSLLVNYGFTLEEADGILKHESLLYAISHVYVFFCCSLLLYTAATAVSDGSVFATAGKTVGDLHRSTGKLEARTTGTTIVGCCCRTLQTAWKVYKHRDLIRTLYILVTWCS